MDVDEAEHDARHNLVEAIQWEIAARVLTLGVNVILDFGFWGKSEREDFRARAARLGASCEIHFLNFSEEILFERLAKRNAQHLPNTTSMNLTFLGTAAANAYTEGFCSCANCQQARKLGGRNLRKRSAALINYDLLIDLGPDVMTAAAMHNCPLTQVRYCLQTHAHADHLDTSHFLSRSPGYGVVGAPRLHFYASAGTLRVAARLLERDCEPHSFFDPEIGERLNLEIHQIEALQQFTMGHYRVTAFTANHDRFVESLLYAIESDGRGIFYGTDTNILPEETWRGFHQHKLCFDVVILDHTYGPDKTGSDHLIAEKFIEHVARMRDEKLLEEGARILATHISHDANTVHAELTEFAARHGYEVAYDGMTV
jgi:phosphoribosyl 1,2-cyclic phosphodiesterase